MPTIIDGTAGITFPNSTIQASAGSVLQVVNATFATETTTASSSFSDTGLTASITPKFSTSKILVIVDVSGSGKDSGNTRLRLKLLRGATDLFLFSSNGGFNGVTQSQEVGTCSTNYLDSPATTSSTTYKVQFANLSAVGSVIINWGSVTSTITLMEIAG
jgi:hypothetical protein